MFYKSTRNSNLNVTGAQAITQGISSDGGLFVPDSLPKLSLSDLKYLSGLSYSCRAAYIFKKFLTDFSDNEIKYCTENAYNTKNFDTENIAEISCLYEDTYILELWHGPTCAFKDMALQILPYFLTTSAKKLALQEELIILVATSGDTGKAALEGFKDTPGTRILVFYPEDGVSPMQKLQMTAQSGSNVGVCAVKGNFDDCQNGVKQIFTNDEISRVLEQNKAKFSSANSINWGRLLPQIVYYISAYVSLMEEGEIGAGDEVNIVVPTGNFGNILAAYYAKKMGLPIKKLICASNKNKVLTDFINTGKYDRNREFYTTCSPSMDILISSNLERLLYELSGGDDVQINKWFTALSQAGSYEVTHDVLEKLQSEFYAGFCDDNETKATIKEIFDKYSYLIDTHTAVAVKVFEDYKKQTGDETKAIIASTASPYKFSASVLEALDGEKSELAEYDMLEKLSSISQTEIPLPLSSLKGKEIRFKDTIAQNDMQDYVSAIIKNK